MGWVYLASNAASEGILILWDKRMVEFIKEWIGNLWWRALLRM